jgi:hypothetical protein
MDDGWECAIRVKEITFEFARFCTLGNDGSPIEGFSFRFGGILTISREMRRQTLRQDSSTDNRQGRANDQTWLANSNMWCGSLVETPRE